MPAGALAGLCPACLLAQGAETDGGGESPSTRRVRFEPPSVEAVARLFPQLEILGLLGAGGMGAVYKARQPLLDRWVALKILPAGGGVGVGDRDGINFAERFNREARALARLSHPNIVAVHEFGQVDGLHFFLMEFVDGTNLRQLEQAGRLSSREALQVIPQICDALQYAHDEGVVHRDIKPENVLVDRKGRVKIADFGLAKIMGQDPDSHRLTAEGQVMGTPHYMAPEQVARPLSVDHRADIYSLGVVFYELLTGDLPLGKFLPPSRKVQVDVRLDDIVLRALENDPARRYQHASEVKSGVETVAASPNLATAVLEPTSGASSLRRDAPPPAPRHAAMRWWRVLTPGLAGFVLWLLVVVATTIITATLPRSFKATAQIAITQPKSGSGLVLNPRLMETAMLRALSPAVLRQAADKLRLSERLAWKVGGGPLSTPEAASMLSSTISVRSIRTGLFTIECWGESAVEVAESANAVAAAFVELSHVAQPSSGVDGPAVVRFEASVIDAAVVPRRASRPNAPLNIAMGLVGGGALGGLAALLVWWLRRRAGVVGSIRHPQRNLFVAGATVALVLGVAFVLIRDAFRNLRLVEARALAEEKAHLLATTQRTDPSHRVNPTAAAQSLHFGPVMERTFDALLDLDTGKTAPYPPGNPGALLSVGSSEQFVWARENGFDVVAGRGELQLLDTTWTALKESEWDTLGPAEVLARIEESGFKPQTFQPLNPDRGTTPTYAFRSREGTAGLIQLTGLRSDSSEFSVRIKQFVP